jgi:hypothetical protein
MGDRGCCLLFASSRLGVRDERLCLSCSRSLGMETNDSDLDSTQVGDAEEVEMLGEDGFELGKAFAVTKNEGGRALPTRSHILKNNGKEMVTRGTLEQNLPEYVGPGATLMLRDAEV